jgi:hypothetical protein
MGRRRMASLESEFTSECPCCGATLTIDANLKRVVGHVVPERGDRPELDHAQRIIEEEAARREAAFQRSLETERTKGDALARRFDEALRQAQKEPVSRPERDFDFD